MHSLVRLVTNQIEFWKTGEAMQKKIGISKLGASGAADAEASDQMDIARQ